MASTIPYARPPSCQNCKKGTGRFPREPAEGVEGEEGGGRLEVVEETFQGLIIEGGLIGGVDLINGQGTLEERARPTKGSSFKLHHKPFFV